MPTPTCASVIIDTSLAPSPIANVVLLGNAYLANSTISYFCLGDILHANTPDAYIAKIKNRSLCSLLWIIICKAYPDIIRVIF